MTEGKELLEKLAKKVNKKCNGIRCSIVEKNIELREEIIKLQTENKNLKETEKEHQELNGRLRQYIKELEEKVEKYRGNWED